MFNYDQVPKTKEYRDNYDSIFGKKEAKRAGKASEHAKMRKDGKTKEERGKK